MTMLAPAPLPEVAPARWRHLGDPLRTRPGQLRLALAVLIATVSTFAGVCALALRDRDRSADTVGRLSHPALLHAANLYVALSDADATASRAFLIGGLEPASERQRYLSGIERATRELTALGDADGGRSDVRQAIRTVGEQLPRYTGLVELARANNRQGFPVGAAYLRQASDTMRSTVLPAVEAIYRTQAARLEADYRTGTRHAGLVVLLALGLLTLALLIGVQVWLFRRTHRVINLGLSAATCVVAVLLIATSVFVAWRASDLADARREGSGSIAVLSSTRILLMRMQADENLALIARGGGAGFHTDFDAVRARLSGTLLPDATEILDDQGAAAEFRTRLDAYLEQHAAVKRLEDAGQFGDATANALTQQAPHFDATIEALDTAIATSEADFARHIDAARGTFAAAYFAAGLGLIGAVLLIGWGIGQRLREYR